MSKKTSVKLPEIPLNGKARVVIESVLPSIDGGAFPIKRMIGERMLVLADIFSDGHDTVQAVLQYKKRGAKDFRETPMRPLGNDRWEAEFSLEEQGFYDYQIIAWVDHFSTWLKSLHKKVDDNQDVNVDLLIGADLLEGAASRATAKADKKLLSDWADSLRDKKASMQERVTIAFNPTLEITALRFSDRSLATHDTRTFSVLVERERAVFSSWYEFFPRSWAEVPGQHGTFRECERILPEIARMGFDVIYLPPIHPIGTSNRKGKNNTLTAEPNDVGSPWAIGSKDGGHKAVEPQLGTLEDFKHFVKKAEKCGLEIALDIAFQCSPDHPYVKEHPQWFNWRPDGTVQYAENPPKKYQDVLPFNFETDDWQALWHELKSIFVFWIQQGVKIFRVDNPHTKPLDFWRWLVAELKEEYPDVLLLSEAFTRPRLKYRLGKLGFTQGYTYFTWRTSKDELTAYMHELTRSEVKDYFRPNFWPNTPDILPQHLQYGGRPSFVLRLILASTLSSNYGIYGPAYELCVAEPILGKEEYFYSEKYEIKQWNWDAPGNLKDIITRLNQIRRQNLALQRTNNIAFVPCDNPQIIAYIKKTPNLNNIIFVVVNLDPYHTQTGWVTLPSEDLLMHGERSILAHDLLTDAKYVWKGEKQFVKLDPHTCPAHIFRLMREQRQEQQFDYYM